MFENIDVTTIVIVLIIAVTIVSAMKYVPNLAKSDTTLLQTRVKEFKQRIEELTEDRDRWMAKHKNLTRKIEQEPEIDDVELSGDLTNPENIKAIIGQFLPSISQYLPKWAQGLAHNPAIAGIAIDYFSKHPDQVASLIGKFVKNKGKSESNNDSQSEKPELENQFTNAEVF